MKAKTQRCNHDCFNCIFDDCVNDTVTRTERIEINQRDIRFIDYGIVVKARHRRSRFRGERH